MSALRLKTTRLTLTPLDLRAIDAWIARDGERLSALTGAVFPSPPLGPPLVEEDLPKLRAMVESTQTRWHWVLWLFRLTADGVAVGAGGCGLGPDIHGMVTFGYSIYPAHQRRGYASEAAQALVQWCLSQEGVLGVRATIPPRHAPSVRVVEKCGLVRVGGDNDPEVGPVDVFERRRKDPSLGG